MPKENVYIIERSWTGGFCWWDGKQWTTEKHRAAHYSSCLDAPRTLTSKFDVLTRHLDRYYKTGSELIWARLVDARGI